jgi:hypothetical protein
MKITKEEERSKKKISTQIDFFLNESSTRDFFQQQNLLPKLNLSDFRILN